MNRLEIVENLLASVRNVTQTHSRYMAMKRNYFNNDVLYMREAHLLFEAGGSIDPTMQDMAQKLGVTPGAVSQLAMRLEKKGFLKRVQSKGDKRQIFIRLTDKGQEFYQRHLNYDKMQYEYIDRMLADYSDEQLMEFITFENRAAELFKKAMGKKH